MLLVGYAGPGGMVFTFLGDARGTDITDTVQATGSLAPASWIAIARGTVGGALQARGPLSVLNDSGAGLRPVPLTPSPDLSPEGRVFPRGRISD